MVVNKRRCTRRSGSEKPRDEVDSQRHSSVALRDCQSRKWNGNNEGNSDIHVVKIGDH